VAGPGGTGWLAVWISRNPNGSFEQLRLPPDPAHSTSVTYYGTSLLVKAAAGGCLDEQTPCLAAVPYTDEQLGKVATAIGSAKR
jgi:hypothetical protein